MTIKNEDFYHYSFITEIWNKGGANWGQSKIEDVGQPPLNWLQIVKNGQKSLKVGQNGQKVEWAQNRIKTFSKPNEVLARFSL